MEGEGEMGRGAKVWVMVLISLCYCYMVGKITQKGMKRLFCLIPVVGLFLALPLSLDSINLAGTTSFFVSWLANFKLLLFAFGHGPLSPNPSLSLPRFVAFACLPIKNVRDQQHPLRNDPNPNLKFAVKGMIWGLLVGLHGYSDQIHPKIMLLFYSLYIYLSLEITLSVAGALTWTLLGIELEPQFREPYLSTSLQDFWGRRWNLVTATILRATVYDPVRDLSSRAVGRKWALLPAVMATFVASGMMHELIFYHLGRQSSTWETTGFFLLHGACLVAEIALKKLVVGRFRLPGLVSGTLTVGFMMVTSIWLFFPQFIRVKADVRALEEYAAMGAFVKSVAVSSRDYIEQCIE